MTRRITVGVPVYRGTQHVAKALASLQEQTFRDFDVIISVDGNDGETAEACRPFLDDPRFRMTVQPKRLDWFGNFNWLLRQELNEFFCYRQHDDTTAPDFFEVLLRVADANPTAAAVYCDCQWVGGRSGLDWASSVEGEPLARLLQYIEDKQPVAVRGLIRREAIRQAGPVRADEFRALSEIFVWLAKVLRWGAFIRHPEPLYFRLDHPDNYHKHWHEWPDERKRAAWATLFTGYVEAIMPVCRTREERLYALHVALDRIAVFREGRSYHYVPASPHSAGALMEECFARLRQEGNLKLLDLDELLAGLRLNDTVEALRAEREMLEAEVARLNRSRMLKLGRRIRRLLGRPDD